MNRKNKVSPLNIRTIAVLALVALPFAALAADAAAPAANGGSPSVSPLTALIPLAVPVVIALLKAFLPKIPGMALPIIAPMLGAVADIALHYAGVTTLGPLWGMVLGSAGVGLRELQDQLKQVILPAPAATTPPRQ